MLRIVSSGLIKRAVTRAHHGNFPRIGATQAAVFHSSPRWENEESGDKKLISPDGTVVATSSASSGYAWYALPLSVAAACPLVDWEWVVFDAEMQLAAVFLFFTVTVYTQVGDVIAKSFDDDANNTIKDHNQIEDKVIAKYQEQLQFLRSVSGIEEGVHSLIKLNEESVEKFKVIATNKPKHELKAQVERALALIQQEEVNTKERLKHTLMAEASSSVTKSFASSQDLRKASLDAAIARIKGSKGGQDPVQGSFVKFFKDKAAAAAKGDDVSDLKAQRETLITKLNTLAENEGFYFNFDKATSQPKLSH